MFKKNPSGYFCDLCSHRFLSNSKLEAHQACHEKSFSHECCICEKRFKIRFHLPIHILTHKESKCLCCSQVFPTSSHLLKHYESYHPEDSLPIKCDLCDKKFSEFDQLFLHRASHFQISKRAAPKIPRTPKIVEKIVFTCDVCGQRTIGTRNHSCCIQINSNEKPFSCEICGKRFLREHRKKEHMKVHDCVVYNCKLCPVSFKNEETLTNHLSIHSELLSFKCGKCSQMYKSNSELACHGGNHPGDKFECDFCEKKFNSKVSLKQHVRIHLNDKLYKCTICPKVFAVSSYLKKHYLSHTGERPYTCEVCSKAFSKSYNFRVHKRIHTGEKPYVCEICKTTFRVKSILKGHYRVHQSEKKSV